MLDGVESERRNNTDGIIRQLTMKLGEESEREESIREAGEEDSAEAEVDFVDSAICACGF
jgi:hypothetical protein